MNLKEAFRFQNRLQRLMDEAEDLLSQPCNITKVEVTYLRRKVMAEVENEVVLSEPTTEFADQINEMADFLLYLLEQRTALAGAIRVAKNGMELDMDAESGLNSQRQRIASVFRRMAGLRAAESLVPGGGTGYRFNADGNQVPYKCDVKRVTTINYDRNKVRALAAQLSAQADRLSTQMDIALVNTPVTYTPLFEVNDTFEEVFRQFCETRAPA